MPTQQEEALRYFDQIISQLTQPDHDLVSILRLGQHACQLLGWNSQLIWFQKELGGYSAQEQLPFYRRISGVASWQPKNTHDSPAWLSSGIVYGHEPEDEETEQVTLAVWTNINWILASSSTGYSESTGIFKTSVPRGKRDSIELQKIKSFSAASFLSIIINIERIVFNFASQSYSTLKFSQAISDIWASYRDKVDEGLQRLGMENHLKSIESNILSENPESCRAAVFECRNMLSDIANYLWQDEREVYEYLDGKDGKKLDMRKGNSKNRLKAYFHQRGFTGTSGKYTRAQVDALFASIDALIEYQSEAHYPVTREDAQTIALSTYFLIGELASKTDLSPVKSYERPA